MSFPSPSLFVIVLFFANSVHAVEAIFQGTNVLTKGAITGRAAGLGWSPPTKSFSAAITSLTQTNYERYQSADQTTSSPMMIQPETIATGEGVSWGGYAFQVHSSQDNYRLASEVPVGADLVHSDTQLDFNSLHAQLNIGYRISRSWALGWSANYIQNQFKSEALMVTQSSSSSSMSAEETQTKDQLISASFGTMFDTELFRLALEVTTPQSRLFHSGDVRTRTLATGSPGVVDGSRSFDQRDIDQWTGSVGVRLGNAGHGFLLADSYTAGGDRRSSFAYETNASWGTITESLAYRDFEGRKSYTLTMGFVRRSENFDWAVGPVYSEDRSTTIGALNSKAYGVMYSSEIRY
mgnify:CR=1 FL=1